MDVLQAQPKYIQMALQMCIGSPDTQLYSLDKSKLFVCTNQDEINVLLLNNPGYTFEQILELAFAVEHTKEEIQVILLTPEWAEQE